MQFEARQFYSDGLKLSGGFFLPDDFEPSAPQPLVIPCSGFTGLMDIHPARFARALTARGRLCFGFDYRGFAESEGPRGRVILDEQVRDILNAVVFAATDPRVDEAKIVLLGWGMAGGLILDAAHALPDLAGLIPANGFFDGPAVQRAHRGEAGFRDFLSEASQRRAEIARSGEDLSADPFAIYPLDAQSRGYVDEVLRKTPDYDAQPYSWVMADSLLRWMPIEGAGRLSVPMLIVHGDANKLHPVSEAERLREVYGGPAELHWVDKAGHTEWMLDEDPKFQATAARIADWLEETLG